MQTIVGPVVVTKEGGFGFDLWTSEEGLSRGFSYRIRLSRTKIRDQVPHAVSGRRDDGVQQPGRIRFGVGETVVLLLPGCASRAIHFDVLANAGPGENQTSRVGRISLEPPSTSHGLSRVIR